MKITHYNADGTVKTDESGGGGGGDTLYNKLLFTATADKTVTNTTTETSLFGTGEGSLTIPAGTLEAGDMIEIRIMGVINAPASAGNLTIRLELGIATLCSDVQTPATVIDELFDFHAVIVCRSPGASGAILGYGKLEEHDSATLVRFWDLQNLSSPTVVDTTADLAIDVTAEWASASTTRNITAKVGYAILRKVAP